MAGWFSSWGRGFGASSALFSRFPGFPGPLGSDRLDLLGLLRHQLSELQPPGFRQVEAAVLAGDELLLLLRRQPAVVEGLLLHVHHFGQFSGASSRGVIRQ